MSGQESTYGYQTSLPAETLKRHGQLDASARSLLITARCP